MHQRALTLGLFGAIVPWLSGCTFDPFCLNCPTGEPDGSPDSSILADSSAAEGGTDPDAVSPCDPNAEEICNGLDDNCDGQIDEGIDL